MLHVLLWSLVYCLPVSGHGGQPLDYYAQASLETRAEERPEHQQASDCLQSHLRGFANLGQHGSHNSHNLLSILSCSCAVAPYHSCCLLVFLHNCRSIRRWQDTQDSNHVAILVNSDLSLLLVSRLLLVRHDFVYCGGTWHCVWHGVT